MTEALRECRADNDTTAIEDGAITVVYGERHSPSETGSVILERRRRSGMEDVSAEGSTVKPPS